MCGIAGFQGIDEAGLIERMRDAVAHRGPDDSGIFTDNASRTSLAHTRLSIIDLSALGHQPMRSDDGRVAIVFNGEIYNFRKLRTSLISRGCEFHSHSDTEVILQLYLHYGEACFAMLNGIFAVAIFDRRDQTLRVARDGFGVKPLYYAECGGASPAFVFASEIKAVMQHRQISRELFIPALQAALTLLWIPGPWTPFRQVHKVLPGECLVIQHGRIARRFSFYELPRATGDNDMSEQEAVHALRTQLQTAVERQLVADVPLGAFLSGGLDSTAIVATAARTLGAANVHCFTIDTGGSVDAGTPDDLPFARGAAEKLGVNLDVLKIDPSLLLQDLPRMLWFLDEPQADPAPLNVMAIANFARQRGYKVLLSGAGGDDIFSGYRRHTALKFEALWRWLPQASRVQLQSLTSSLAGVPQLRRVAKAFANAGMTSSERLLAYFTWMPESQSANLLSPEARALAMQQCHGESVSPVAPLREWLAALPAHMPALDKMLQLDTRFFLVDHNFNYTDKMSMAAGVETRVPLLDPDLVALAAQIPAHLKHRGVHGKWIFRKAMEGIVPNDVIWRKKSGFGAPLRRWLHNELRPLLEETLSPQAIRARGLFDAKKVEELIRHDRNGAIDAAYPILSLMCIELWCRQFVDPQLPQMLSL